jgi:ADP-ribosylglycohydrolase
MLDIEYNMDTLCERYIGTLLGGCIGDILGSTNEGKTFDFIRSNNRLMETFNINKYTDDTELTLILAKYLAKDGNNQSMAQEVHSMYHHVVKRSKRGYSKRTRDILSNWNACMLANDADTNGSVMRISPLALIKHNDDQDLYNKIKYATYCTHSANKNAMDTSFIHVKLLISMINQTHTTAESVYLYAQKLAKRVRNPIIYTYLTSIHPDNRARFQETNWNVNMSLFGYDLFQIKAIDCFICAMVCFLYNFKQPRDALIMAANLGGDTDTIAKLVGDLIGATYGTSWIPSEWRNPEGRDELINIAKTLYNRSHTNMENKS